MANITCPFCGRENLEDPTDHPVWAKRCPGCNTWYWLAEGWVSEDLYALFELTVPERTMHEFEDALLERGDLVLLQNRWYFLRDLESFKPERRNEFVTNYLRGSLWYRLNPLNWF